MKDLLIFPFGGNARESLLVINSLNNVKPTWNILGFIDDNKYCWGKKYLGIKVLGGRDILSCFPTAKIIAVPGNPKNFLIRSQIISQLNQPLDRFISIIDPNAQISPDAKIGLNSVLMANVVVSCSVKIGNHCIVLPNTVISHDSYIGDHVLIGSNVTISGSCRVEHTCYIASGTSIKDHLTIGPKCLIGLGSCVIENVPEKTVVVGNPARYLRDIE